jgi:serine/threonine-protein kinase
VTDASDLFERLKAPLADRYELERELGKGGMAIVFLARDVKHDREVALKVFRPELAISLGAERFLREIQIAAKLSHPHILPLYDSGEVDGLLYYTMPFVEGESLGDRMKREHMLPLDDAQQIAREVADALSYAHAHGLVHRDIKPDNIMLTGGHAVVMDFGIARAVEAAGGNQLTQTGMAVGTPLYMSPEQAAAEGDLDGRSDIYALGCVLYEMVAGTPPFTGPSAAVIARHIADHVPSPSIIRETISPEFEDIIMCALAKAPADRFRTAGDFGEALKALQTGTGMMPRMSVLTQARRAGVTRTSLTPPSLRTRRVPQLAAAYGAGSWIVLEVLDQLIGNQILPQLFYQLALTLVVTLAPGVLVVAWFHGEKGAQTVPLIEKWLLVGVATLALVSASVAYRAAAPVAPVDGGPPLNRVAVLYLEDLSPNQEFQYVADGLTEGIIRRLSQVRALDVISLNGVAPFREADASLDSIARALEVGSVIDGSVEPDGDQLRVTLRLVDGPSGAVFDRASLFMSVGQSLAAVDSVTGEVSRLLRQRLGEEIQVRQQRARASVDEAWLFVQRAERLRKDAAARFQESGSEAAVPMLLQADSLLELAEQVDPNWQEPTVLRGWVAYDGARMYRDLEVVPWIEAGLGHAERAFEASANDPEALNLRGHLRYRFWGRRVTPDPAEWEGLLNGARQDLEAAVQADPTLTRAQITLSSLYYAVDDVPAALLAARRAYEEDAYLSDADAIVSRLFWGSIDLEQFSQARRWCTEGARRWVEQARFVACQLTLMATPAVPPDVDEAWRLLAKLDSLTPNPRQAYLPAAARMDLGGTLARAGLPDSARSMLLRARARGNPEIDPTQELLHIEAYMRSLLGDNGEAIDLLRRYVAANPDHDFAHTAGTAWWWRELRTHPRFVEIMGTGG